MLVSPPASQLALKGCQRRSWRPELAGWKSRGSSSSLPDAGAAGVMGGAARRRLLVPPGSARRWLRTGH